MSGDHDGTDVQRDLTADEKAVMRKVYRRLVWFLVALFICSYLDRINISFAALAMNKDLHLTATMFGVASSLFYVAYIAAEIPSNMMMPRLGARIWIPRIMITWGIASAATMFATGPYSLYALRALTGLAEAGFMPGILLYLTYWFPSRYRARATAAFIMAQPITILFGSTLSGLILDMHGLGGLAGWKWLFLLEGLPAIGLGVVAYFYLSDGPETARWLSPDERRLLQGVLARDDVAADARTPHASATRWRELTSPPVLLLSFAYLGLVVSLITNSTWVPQIVRAVVPGGSFVEIGLIAGIAPLAAILTMSFWGRHSDDRGERRWHLALPMLLAAAGWLCVALLGQPVERLVGLVMCAVGTFAAQGIFWTLPATYLSAATRPVGIAMINTIGMLGTTVGPVVVGWLKDYSGTFTTGLLFVSTCIVAGAGCVLTIASARPAPLPPDHPLTARAA